MKTFSRNKKERNNERKSFLFYPFHCVFDTMDRIRYAINDFNEKHHYLYSNIGPLYLETDNFNNFISQLTDYDNSKFKIDEVWKSEYKLFRFEDYKIDILVAELKQFDGQASDYQDILSEKEINCLCKNEKISKFISEYENVPKGRFNKSESLASRIAFLSRTVEVCTDLIKNIDLFFDLQYEENKKNVLESISSGPITPNLDDEE